MAEDEIRYDLLTQEALRGVIRTVLARAARAACPASIISTSRSAPTRRRRNRIEAPERAISGGDDHRPAVPVLGPAGDQRALRGEAVVQQRAGAAGRAVPGGKAFYDPSAQFGLQFGKPGAANNSARQHMAAALPDLVGEPEEPHGAASSLTQEESEKPAAEAWSFCGHRRRSCISTASARNSRLSCRFRLLCPKLSADSARLS